MIQSEESDENFPSLPLFPDFTPIKSSHLLTISVISTKILNPKPESIHASQYFITPQGIFYSLRTPPDGTFKIGRQQTTDLGQAANDMILPSTDKAVSRFHCMIKYSEYFKSLPTSCKLAFLMGTHKRLSQNSVLRNLPTDLFRYILNFFPISSAPKLVDLGSTLGTYLKLASFESVLLSSGMRFLIGGNSTILIESIQNSSTKSISSEVSSEESGTNIMDLPSITIHLLDASPASTTGEVFKYKFIAEAGYKEIRIGRSKSCDIRVNELTVSRVQCQVLYKDEAWVLVDGSFYSGTLNGTWMNLSKRDDGIRVDSDPVALKPLTQIRVSETVIQIDYLN